MLLATREIRLSGYNRDMSRFPHLTSLLFLALIVLSGSAYSESLDEVCREYQLEKDTHGSTEGHQKAHLPESQNNEFSNGLLWKIETESGNTNYLFGTMHSQDRAVTQFPPHVRLALAQSHSLIIETVLNDASTKVFFDSIFFKEQDNNEHESDSQEQTQQKLSDLIHAPVYDYLEETLPDYGLPAEKITHLKPWAAFTLIGRPRPVNAATQDMVLIQTATSLNKTVVSLETMQELIEPMDTLSLDDQVTILNDTVCNHKQIIRDSWSLLQLYLARDLSGMLALNDEAHYDEAIFDRYIQGILYDRNERMLRRIMPYLDTDSVFIAVGALHLAGEKGLLQALKEQGYKITRVY